MQLLTSRLTPPTVGMIGAGRMARIHADAWLRLGARVLVFSSDGVEQLAAERDVTPIRSLGGLLDAAEVVDIVSPSDTHAEYALRAIDAGRDVVCEKPLALTLADAEAISSAAARMSARVFPAHVTRFARPNLAAKSAVSKGRIGRIAMARFHRRTPAPPADSWFIRPELSGGIVFDLLLHDLDQARWFCGEVSSVFAVQNAGPTGDGDTVTGVHATLTHTNGAISQVTATWAAADSRFRSSFAIAGEQGTLRYDSAARRDVVLEAPQSDAEVGVRGLPNPYTAELTHFLESRAGAPARVEIEDGLEAVRLAEATVTSIIKRQPVSLIPENRTVSHA